MLGVGTPLRSQRPLVWNPGSVTVTYFTHFELNLKAEVRSHLAGRYVRDCRASTYFSLPLTTAQSRSPGAKLTWNQGLHSVREWRVMIYLFAALYRPTATHALVKAWQHFSHMHCNWRSLFTMNIRCIEPNGLKVQSAMFTPNIWSLSVFGHNVLNMKYSISLHYYLLRIHFIGVCKAPMWSIHPFFVNPKFSSNCSWFCANHILSWLWCKNLNITENNVTKMMSYRNCVFRHYYSLKSYFINYINLLESTQSQSKHISTSLQTLFRLAHTYTQ